MKAYYLSRRQADVPEGTGWLAGQELAVLEGLSFPKRRSDWLLGRWTAKSALILLDPSAARSPSDWCIQADDRGAPAVLLRGRAAKIRISLSHSQGRSLCLLAAGARRIGCDLEKVEHRSRSFEETWFTPGELDWLGEYRNTERNVMVTLTWSAKESVLKVIRKGLKADTRRIDIRQPATAADGGWARFEALDHERDETFLGWWRLQDGMVCSTACKRPFREPIAL